MEDRNLDAVAWLSQVLRGGEVPNTPEFKRAVEIVVNDWRKSIECIRQVGLPWTSLVPILGKDNIETALTNIASSPDAALDYARVVKKIDPNLPPVWGWGAGQVSEITKTALNNILSNSLSALEYYRMHILDGREWPGAKQSELGRRAVESIAANPSTAVMYARWRGQPWVDGEIGYERAMQAIKRSTRARNEYAQLLQIWNDFPAQRRVRRRN